MFSFFTFSSVSHSRFMFVYSMCFIIIVHVYASVCTHMLKCVCVCVCMHMLKCVCVHMFKCVCAVAYLAWSLGCSSTPLRLRNAINLIVTTIVPKPVFLSY